MPSNPVRAVSWEYLGGDVVTSPENGVTSIQVTTLPRNCTILELRPNGGDLYFEINGAAFTSTNVPGYVVDGGGEIIGPLAELSRLDVYVTDGGAVHIMFLKEHGSY